MGSPGELQNAKDWGCLPLVDSAEAPLCISEELEWSGQTSASLTCLRDSLGPGPVAFPPRSHSRIHAFIPHLLIEHLLCGKLSRSEEEEGKGQSCYLPWQEGPLFSWEPSQYDLALNNKQWNGC